MELEWIPVDSERITQYAYDDSTGVIYVIFTDGVMWGYFDCGPELWEQFQLAQSKGRFIRDFLDKQRHGPV